MLALVGFSSFLAMCPARASGAYRWPHSSLRHTRIDGRRQRWSHPQWGRAFVCDSTVFPLRFPFDLTWRPHGFRFERADVAEAEGNMTC